MGFSPICSLERKEDYHLIIILKFFLLSYGVETSRGDTEGGMCLHKACWYLLCLLLSGAAGNSCLLHLPQGFVSLVVWKVALDLQNAADSQF